MGKCINVEVKLGGRIKSVNQLIRRFIKLCKEERIVKEVKDKRFFVSKAEKRRSKKHRAKRRNQKRNVNK